MLSARNRPFESTRPGRKISLGTRRFQCSRSMVHISPTRKTLQTWTTWIVWQKPQSCNTCDGHSNHSSHLYPPGDAHGSLEERPVGEDAIRDVDLKHRWVFLADGGSLGKDCDRRSIHLDLFWSKKLIIDDLDHISTDVSPTWNLNWRSFTRRKKRERPRRYRWALHWNVERLFV